MSFKRRVLSVLGKDLLLEIGHRLELGVTTRMGEEELRDALARSKRAKLNTGRDAHRAFTTRFLECFGWKDDGRVRVIAECGHVQGIGETRWRQCRFLPQARGAA